MNVHGSEDAAMGKSVQSLATAGLRSTFGIESNVAGAGTSRPSTTGAGTSRPSIAGAGTTRQRSIAVNEQTSGAVTSRQSTMSSQNTIPMQNQPEELDSIHQARSKGVAGGEQTSAAILLLQQQLGQLARELNDERQRRQNLQREIEGQQASWEEPIYMNEQSQIRAGAEQRIGTIGLPNIDLETPQIAVDFSSPLRRSAVLRSNAMPCQESLSTVLRDVNMGSVRQRPSAPVSVQNHVQQLSTSAVRPSGSVMPIQSAAVASASCLPQCSLQGTTISPSTSVQIIMKPRQPPVFTGKVSEDIEMWISTVRAYFRTVAAPESQKVGFTLTLLQDAAKEWWIQWVRQRGGVEPSTFEELAAALYDRFANRSKERVAQAELRTIQQLKNENIRTYAARFTRLLGHLHNYDEGWAQDQFTSGLEPKVAEYLLLKDPQSLQEAMVEAEHIEVTLRYAKITRAVESTSVARARNQQGESWQRCWRKEGGQDRGAGQRNQRLDQSENFLYNCHYCGGFGHKSAVCPSWGNDRGQGRYRGDRKRRSGGSGQGRQMQNAGIATAGNAGGAGTQTTPLNPPGNE